MGTPESLQREPAYWHARDVKGLVLAFGALTASATLVLFVMADSTDQYWAWTISPSVTAAFLGAGYLAGLTGLVVLALTRTQQLRLGLMAIFTFVFVTAVATLMHLEPFHLTDEDLLPAFVAWIWLIVYVAVPFWILFVVRRLPKDTAPAGAPGLPLSYRVLLWAQGLVLATLGLILFIAPETSGTLWPWELSPLTARCISAWLLFAAVVASVVARLRGHIGSEVALVVYTLLPVLQGIAMARFHTQVDWDTATPLVALLSVMMVTGLAGAFLVRHQGAAATVPGGRK